MLYHWHCPRRPQHGPRCARGARPFALQISHCLSWHLNSHSCRDERCPRQSRICPVCLSRIGIPGPRRGPIALSIPPLNCPAVAHTTTRLSQALLLGRGDGHRARSHSVRPGRTRAGEHTALVGRIAKRAASKNEPFDASASRTNSVHFTSSNFTSSIPLRKVRSAAQTAALICPHASSPHHPKVISSGRRRPPRCAQCLRRRQTP